jgi:F-type H+-transporting ATPase subunit b
MTFNVWTFLFETLNFLVLAYVLHRLLYRPLRQAIDQRRESAARAQKEADLARQQALALEQQLRTQLAGLEEQRQETMHQAREQAQAERQRLLTEAERAVQRRQEEVRQSLDRERAEAWRVLRGEVVGQAIDLSRRLLREASGTSLDQHLALRLADSLSELPSEQREQVRSHWEPCDGAVLELAHELDGGVVQRLNNAAQAILGSPVELAVQTRPALLGGARLRLGGHVWDSSLEGQLQSAVLGAEESGPCPSTSSS